MSGLVLNAMQLKAGAKAENNKMSSLTQPLQFLPREEKTIEWHAQFQDWAEWQGLKQLRRNAKRLMKNYKLAKGIIDKTDYIVEDNTENGDLISALTKEDTTALELKFYPIIPNVVNTLVSEFAKRSTRVFYRSTDDYSYNEMLEQKRSDIEQVLLQDAESRLKLKLQEQGIDPDSDQAQQQLSPQNLKTLPEIQNFYTKSYKDICEQWAEHQHNADVERFHMEELEERAFRDMLITDREFWHFKMGEDDYDIELWNPALTFYHKSPDARYISQSNYVGRVDMMTSADVIDKYGWVMTQDQQESIEAIYPVRSAGYAVTGYQNDGSYYDATKSHDWNTKMPSLGFRQFMSTYDYTNPNGDIVNWILSENEDFQDFGTTYLLRVTTTYWKSQRKVGHLTKIDEIGNTTIDVVDESYKITDKPIYNTTLFKNKNKENLLFGEHIDWIWINEVRGGVKIGPNRPSFWGQPNYGGITPIYLGINQNQPGRLTFQFKGDDNLYGCKLPVEGSVFSDRNTRSTSLVDLMKPFQVGYNIVNNQIADILIDELGTVIMLDQNALPRHSLNEDWGKGNYAKAYVAMKNFQILPLDSTITNTENALANGLHFQKLDMTQTERLLGRIQLANYFQTQAFATIGITPQRLGEEVEQATATGVNVAVANSYAQTETYFINHCDYLMPRVHQMRTDLAQFYQSKKPSVRLSYITTAEDRANFRINGTSLLLRDIGVFVTTNANIRHVMQQLKQLAFDSKSSGATIYDLGHIIKSESISEIDGVLKASQDRQDQERKQEQEQEQQMQQQAIQDKINERREKMAFEADQNERDRQASILEREIQAAGYSGSVDKNNNAQNDYLDALKYIQQGENYRDTMNLQTSKQQFQQQAHTDKMELGREKLMAEKEKSNTALKIAQTNQTRAELQAKRKLKEAKKKKSK